MDVTRLFSDSLQVLSRYLDIPSLLRLAMVNKTMREAIQGGSGRILFNSVKFGPCQPLPQDGIGIDLEGATLPQMEAAVECACFAEIQRMNSAGELTKRLSFVDFWSSHINGVYGGDPGNGKDHQVSLRCLGEHSIFFSWRPPRIDDGLRCFWGFMTPDAMIPVLKIRGLHATTAGEQAPIIPCRILSSPKRKGKVFGIALQDQVLFKLNVGRDQRKRLNAQQVTAILRWFLHYRGVEDQEKTIQTVVEISHWTRRQIQFAWEQAKREK